MTTCPSEPALPPTQTWVVYFLECRGGTIYTGSTNDLSRRLGEHRRGVGAKYTRSHLPVTLLAWTGPFEHRSAAARFEAKAQMLARKKKLELVAYLLAHPGQHLDHPYLYASSL